MALVQDLTVTELSAEISDGSLQAWWDAAAPLPADIPFAEFMAKTMQAAYIAQQKKNLAAAPLVGEALNCYLVPNNAAPQTDIESGLTAYIAQHTLRVTKVVDANLTVPGR